MGRPSKLTDVQWNDIIRRHLAGEKLRPLAREYGVAESSLREKISARAEAIETVADQLVTADRNLRALPVSAQMIALDRAEAMRVISDCTLGTAAISSRSALRLSTIAHSHVERLDTDDPDAGTLRTAATMQAMANEAMKPALALIAANKGRDFGQDDDGPANVQRIERVIIDVTN